MKILYRGRHAAKAHHDPAPVDDPSRLFESAEAVGTTMTTSPTGAVRGPEHSPNVSRPARP